MKLSLIAAASLASLAVLAMACGNSSEEKKPDETPKPAETPGPAPNTEAPTRQLVDGKAHATTPVNLLADPGFSLVGRDNGYGSFLGFYDGGSSQFVLESTFDSRSPTGFGGSVALVRPAKATDDKSQGVTLLTSFLGGKGPFHAKIWVSKSNVAGEPVELPTDGSAIEVSVADGNPTGGKAYDLKVDPAVTKTIAGRTWVLLSADVAQPLESGGFFVIHTGTKGGHIHLAAPEVTTDQITIGQAVQSTTQLHGAVARPKNVKESFAIKLYKSQPPRLVPADPKPQFE